MSKKIFRTIAFQVDDQEFLKAYDQRQQDSGLSVKNYFLSLINYAVLTCLLYFLQDVSQ